MRKNIITSALLLGTLGAYSGSFTFVGKPFETELSNGKKIEIILQEEVYEEDYRRNAENTQADLSRQVMSHEKMLQLLNQIRKEEREVIEEFTL